MGNVKWQELFPSNLVVNLPLPSLDHCGIWLKLGSPLPSRGQQYFKFLGPWLSRVDFYVQLRNAWRHGDSWATNMLSTLATLGKWNTEAYGNIFQRQRRLIARLEGIDRQLIEGSNERLQALKKELWSQYNTLLDHEEAYWFQQSRSQWLRLGDCNTRYFHQKTLVRRHQNRVEALLNGNGEWVYEEDTIQATLDQYYKALFTSSVTAQCPILHTTASYPAISEGDILELGAPINISEVRRALFSMGNYKAPGPDGFHPIFFKSSGSCLAPQSMSLCAKLFIILRFYVMSTKPF